MIEPQPQYAGFNITFNVTEDCNLRCKYCYELNKKPGDLPLEYAKKFIDLILDDPDPIGVMGTSEAWIMKQGLILDFIGGDALMRPILTRDILRYFIFASTIKNHRWATRWRSSISTNGTLFGDPNVRDFLEEFKGNISLGISVDGSPTIHNLNRSNSMDDILKYWDWYIQYVGLENATTKSTLNKESIPYLYDSLKFMHLDLGLRNINQNFIFEPLYLEEKDLSILDEQMEKCVDFVLQHKNDLYWSIISKEFGVGKPMQEPDKGWCGSGAMPALSINGKIYPCFRFMPHTMSSKELDFYVGDVFNGFYHKDRFKLIRDQTRANISKPECISCPVESNCAWCIGSAYAECGKFYRQTNICEIHKIQSKWAEIYWKKYNELDNSL